MLQNIQTEIQRYERLVNYWPVYAPMLEEAVCNVLRAVTASITRRCGLMPARKQIAAAGSYNGSLTRCVMMAWQFHAGMQWHAVPLCQHWCCRWEISLPLAIQGHAVMIVKGCCPGVSDAAKPKFHEATQLQTNTLLFRQTHMIACQQS